MNYFNEIFAKDQQGPMPDDDPIGIEAWASESGIPVEVAFALAASVLAGVAGYYIVVNVPVAGPSRPGLNLVARQGDYMIELATRGLTEGLFDIQEALRAKSGDHTVENLHRARYEGRKYRNADDLQQVENHLAVGRSSSKEAHEQLGEDLRRIEESVRMEALLHPSFLLSGTLGQSLEGHLAGCHSGYGYYCGNPGPLSRSQTLRNKQIEHLLKFLLGTTVMSGNSKFQTPVDSRELVLRGLFLYSQQDLKYLVVKRRDLVGNMLLVSSDISNNENRDYDPVTRYGLAANFLERFYKAAKLCLGFRRAGLAKTQGFTRESARHEFERQQREFLRELSQSPYADLTPQAARLPAMLVWMISLLGPDSGPDDYILASAIPIARKLTEAGLRPYLMADQEALVEKQLRMAGKLHARLRRLQPCKARTLRRGLDQQNIEIVSPVLDALIVHGIVDQAPDKTLRVGQVPLSRLDFQKLLLPSGVA